MNKILELRQKRAEAWDKARAFLDEHTSENGVMSAEDSQQYERIVQRRGKGRRNSPGAADQRHRRDGRDDPLVLPAVRKSVQSG